ncbi:MAG: glycosyltransferase [Planctomycetota bacterium]
MANPPLPVWIPRRYESRYGLLGAMAGELADACSRRGLDVRDHAPDGSEAGIFIFFNMPQAIEAIPAAVRRPGSRIAAVQILVDHPLALATNIMDATSRLPNFRLALPSIDGLHLLRLRWPTLVHGHVPHGIPPSALVPNAELAEHALAAREFDVVVAGSIHSREEQAVLRASVPAQTHAWIDEIVTLMHAEPLMPFEQAIDLVMGARSVVTGAWPMLAGLWRVAAAELNYLARTTYVESLQGLDVAVFGSDAWIEHCTGTIRYAGNTSYSDLPAALARGRVCFAWGPTQFEHTFSERLLLSMAAGCASVAEDRYMIGRHFAFDGNDQALATFDPRSATACRETIESLLADEAARNAIARRGRRAVQASHLWDHRVESIVSLAAEALVNAAHVPGSQATVRVSA